MSAGKRLNECISYIVIVCLSIQKAFKVLQRSDELKKIKKHIMPIIKALCALTGLTNLDSVPEVTTFAWF